MEVVTLVDENGLAVGVKEKLRAHAEGNLHRAFSVFIFDFDGRLLLQKRAKTKYHSGGLWSNTCCGHPRPHELIDEAARRRLEEEMGFGCELRASFNFMYKIRLDNELIEHEFDHVFAGRFNDEPSPDPAEVEDWRWLSLKELRDEIQAAPGNFTYWLKIAIDREEWRQVDEIIRTF